MYINKNNLTPEERFEVESKTRNNPRARYYTMDGKTMCVRAWCKELGLSHNTVNERLKAGLSFDEAISAGHRTTGRRAKMIEIDGEKHSVSEWSKLTGVPIHKYYYKKRHGKDDREIFMNPRPNAGGIAFGQHYTSRKWSDITGIRYGTICAEVKKNTLEQFIRDNLTKKIHGVTVAERLEQSGIQY